MEKALPCPKWALQGFRDQGYPNSYMLRSDKLYASCSIWSTRQSRPWRYKKCDRQVRHVGLKACRVLWRACSSSTFGPEVCATLQGNLNSTLQPKRCCFPRGTCRDPKAKGAIARPFVQSLELPYLKQPQLRKPIPIGPRESSLGFLNCKGEPKVDCDMGSPTTLGVVFKTAQGLHHFMESQQKVLRQPPS